MSHYIATGVKADCTTLLRKFSEKQCVRYATFAEIWREMNFSLIYSGRISFAELYEFTEEMFLIAKEFFLPPNDYQTRLGGLYLLYGLYYKQPTIEDDEPFVKIRLTMEEWLHTMNLIRDLYRDSHFDALFIFNRMLKAKAFYFCAMPREFGIERSLRRHLRNEENEIVSGSAAFKFDMSNLEADDVLVAAEAALDEYYNFKCQISKNADQKVPDELLNYASPNVIKDLKALVSVDEKKDKVEEEDIGTKRKRIRQEATKFRQIPNKSSLSS